MIENKPFKLTASQEKAAALLTAPDIHNVLLYGGSRSGKSFYILRLMVIRAMKYANSRQTVLRRTFSDCRTSIGMDTLPKVLKLCFPELTYHLDKTDWFFRFDNGSEIWMGGLDDKERVDKILGKEYITIYFNEASQISYQSVTTAMSRLAQLCADVNGTPAINKAYYDCNPPTKSHWLFTLFVKKMDPIENIPLADPDDFAMMQMNPDGNKENINKEYLENTLANMPYRQRMRFLAGEFMEDLDSGLWTREMISPKRVQVSELPQLVRVVVGVDPAVTANEKSDATGIVVVGADINGELYVLDDATIKASPALWAKAVCDMYYQHDADRIVGEVNNGGDLVEMNLRNIDKSVSYKSVHASKGKIVRAEPVAHLYERGLVHHVGIFPELEDEMCEYNPADSKASPNRLDALVWSITELSIKKSRACIWQAAG